MAKWTGSLVASVWLLLANAGIGRAARPLITDDAAVVGARAAQVETWARLDRDSFQHWLLVGVGLMAPVELTVGAVQGLTRPGAGYSFAAPVVQLKLLLVEPAASVLPGLAIAGAVFPRSGRGELRPPGWEYLGNAAMTSVLLDGRLLVHGNIGVFATTSPGADPPELIWAVAMQADLVGSWQGAAEVFSGDPYQGAAQATGHMGLRYVVNETLQLDVTVGRGLAGAIRLPLWGTLGLRLAGQDLW